MAFNLASTLGLTPSRSKFRANQEQAVQGLDAMLPVYEKQAATAGQTASTFDPLRTSSARSLYDRYAKGFDGGGLLKKKMLGNVDSRFASASANARTQAMNSGANPTSALALIGAKRAQALSSALSGYEGQKLAEDERYARGAYGVASDMYGRGLGEQNAALGRQGNILGQQFSQYGNLAQQDEQRQNAGRQALMGLIQTAASAYGASQGVPPVRQQTLPDNGAPGGDTFMPYNGAEPFETPYDGSFATMVDSAPYGYGDRTDDAPWGGRTQFSNPQPTVTQALVQMMRQPRSNARIF